MNSILIVDDRPENLEVMRDILSDHGFEVRVSTDFEGAMRAIDAQQPDLLLLDLWLRNSAKGGMEILETVQASMPQVPVVMISAHGNIETALEAIHKGALDFVEKPVNTKQLMAVVHRALEVGDLRRENAVLRRREHRQVRLLGDSMAMTRLRELLNETAKRNSRVLFHGPVGSGKEEAARYLHLNSPRAAGPFHVVGGAVLGRGQGRPDVLSRALNRAEGGTLLIDEVADTSQEAQMALLRILVSQTRSPSTETGSDPHDVRILSSTAQDLRKAIEMGRFRKDLYHRLAVVDVEMPPLVQRLADIPVLMAHFMELLAEDLGSSPRPITNAAMQELKSYSWPGNLRELKNIAERLVLAAGAHAGHPVGIGELPPEIHGITDVSGSVESAYTLPDEFLDLPLRVARTKFDKLYLLAHVARACGNVPRMATVVGMERAALHRKLRDLGITPEVLRGHRIAATRDGEGRGAGADNAKVDAP